jgi:CRISPR-associated protein Csm3
MTTPKLCGRVFLIGMIRAQTGLHVGGSPGALSIGSVDMPVIRDATTGRPYIPGSSLKGKLRSLSEKYTGAPQNKSIGENVKIHVAGGERKKYSSEEEYRQTGEKQYQEYWVNPLFGLPGEIGFEIPAPNRLLVRDIPMLSDPDSNPPIEGSVEYFQKIKTDLPFTEVKWEAAIDRVTSAATPRQIERVPAGAVFAPMEMVFSYYLEGDEALIGNLLTAMELLEDDYLGGHGSRGSGKIEFRGLKVYLRKGAAYQEVRDPRFAPENGLTLPQLAALKVDLVKWVAEQMKLEEG